MNRETFFVVSLALLLSTLSACGGSGPEGSGAKQESPAPATQDTAPAPEKSLKQIGQERSGDYIVTLLSETGAVKQGPNRFVLEVRNAATNELTPVEQVHIETNMEMQGHPPMIGSGSAVPGDVPGRYIVGSDFAAKLAIGDTESSPSAGRMAGQWKLVVTFHPNQRIEFSASVQ